MNTMAKKRKFNKTKEWLIEEYVIKNRSRKEIAKECGLTEAGLKSILLQYNITKDNKVINIESVRTLLQQGKSVKEIIKELGSSSSVIYRIMKANNLAINYIPNYSSYDSSKDELICSLYLDGFSTTEIAKEIGVSHRTILNHLNHCNIQIRNLQAAQFAKEGKVLPEELISYNSLYDLYVTQHKSKKDLGKMFNVDSGTINTCLRNLNIPIRNNSESKIGINTGSFHPNWQGGITPLYMRLRESFRTILVPKILKRDNYTCQLCGAKGNLHVHHIIHFSDIMKEILLEHSELNPINNINELYNIAVRDSRLNDLNNLITCCPNCHYNIYHKRK